MMKILFTICGRAGSKGIHNKNIRDFLGYPLPYYTLSAIDLYKKKTPKYDMDVVVNSDSQELLTMMRNNPFFVIDTIERDISLSGDLVPKSAVILNCLEYMQTHKKIMYDMVVDLDITSPLRTIEDIENLIETHIKSGADITVSVTDARRNPYFNMLKKTDKGYKKVLDSDFVARQQAPELFDMNASLYAYKPEYFYTGQDISDKYCECIHMYDTGILDLDHENDFELMQVIANYLYEKKPEFGEVRENIKRAKA